MIIHDLFIDFLLSDTIEYDYDKVLDYINSNKEHLADERIFSQRGGFQSKKLVWCRDDSNPAQDLVTLIVSKFNNVLAEKDLYQIKLHNYWININYQHCYNTKHRHPGCQYSGVIYLKVPDDTNSPITFHRDASHDDYHLSNNKMGPYLRYASSYQPQKGLCLIFPGYIDHDVAANQSKEERISISFNLGYA